MREARPQALARCRILFQHPHRYLFRPPGSRTCVLGLGGPHKPLPQTQGYRPEGLLSMHAGFPNLSPINRFRTQFNSYHPTKTWDTSKAV